MKALMMDSSCLVPSLVDKTTKKLWASIVAVTGGVVALSLLAQVAIPLPWTPVPITGQTFGIMLMAMLWGRKLGTATITMYLLVGAMGLPVFAQARSGFAWGPTMGYLLGMWVAAVAMGVLADRGWATSFWKCIGLCAIGTVCIFSLGLIVLSQFMPSGYWMAGFLPFMPGNVIKSVAASAIASRLNRKK